MSVLGLVLARPQALSSLPSSEVGADVGEEDLRHDRYRGDLDPLVRGPVAERAGRELGGGPQDATEVHGPGSGGGDRAGRPADGRGGLAHAGDRVVPGVGRHRVAAVELAKHRTAPRLHRRPAQGRGDGGDDPSAPRRRAWPGRVGGERAPVGAGEPARGRPPRAGHGAARLPAGGVAGADRLRPVGDVAGSGHRGGGARCGRS